MFGVHEIDVPLLFPIKLFLSSLSLFLFMLLEKSLRISSDLHAKHAGLADIFQVSTPSSKTVN